MELKESKYLHRIDSVEQLRALSLEELPVYCAELRQFIIESVATNPGHLGSSLGVVELTVALHYVYDTPSDRLLFDVGHQAYAHKIITGRRDRFDSNRKMGGISGFPRRAESEFDCFGVGHASTSISAAVGMAEAVRLKGENRKVVAVIGDGALTGGLAFEGLNNADNCDLLVILNDNKISIDPNVGALKEYLLSLTTSKKYNRFKDLTWRSFNRTPRLRRILQKIYNGAKSFFLHRSNLFEALNFRYFGPIDGHDVQSLVKRLQDLKSIPGPKLLHALTVKGKGYAIAEREQTEWHAPGVFDAATGRKAAGACTLRYQDVFGHTLLELARANNKIVGITPAMPSGSSLNILMEAMPERAFDVGIAEGHAVTFAAGLATEGFLPYCSIYSSFAQRAIDNIIHDVALQGLDVVLCLDRAGLVGEDGATHHGVFDIALLRSVPGVIIAAPSSGVELRNMLYEASLGGYGGCFVVRYARGGSFDRAILSVPMQRVPIGVSRVVSERGGEVAVLSLGVTCDMAAQAAEQLGATHIDLRYAKPLDTTMLADVAARFKRVVVVEDGVANGGVGSAVRDFYAGRGLVVDVRSVALPDEFVEHGKVAELQQSVGLTAEGIIKAARA